MEKLITDVAIIGAGPAGMFAVFECGMLKMSCVLIDSLAEAGGQCAALYPEKPIYDIPGHPAIEAAELIAPAGGADRALRRAASVRAAGDRAAGAKGAFTLTTDAGDEIAAKAVIVAAGAGAFGPNRPPLAGLAAYEESGAVQYYVKRKEACAASGW